MTYRYKNQGDHSKIHLPRRNGLCDDATCTNMHAVFVTCKHIVTRIHTSPTKGSEMLEKN